MTGTPVTNDAHTDTSKPGFRTWLGLGILVLAAVFSFIDRQILSLMVTPIKADLGIDDVQVGLLQGFAFATFYALAAVPLGWLADRASRKWILSIGIASWSIMTALCGLSQNFTQLFLARMGVGVGEATLSASGHSMIADMFDQRQLPMAMSIYAVGVSLGGGIAFVGGGYLVELLSKAGDLQIAGITLAAWQATFILVGLPGVFIALLLAVTIKDPARRAVLELPSGKQVGFTSFVTGNSGLAWRFIAGIGLLTAAGYANLAWLPSYFERTFSWSTAQAGTVIGILLLAVALPGGLLCGYLTQLWIARGQEDAPMRVMSYASLATAPIMAIAFLLSTPTAVVIALLLPMAVGSCYVGLGPAAAQAVTPGQLRGRVAAFQMLLTGLIGMVSGPLIVGILTKYVFENDLKIGWSLAISAPVLSTIGALLLLSALPDYRRALADINQKNAK